MRLEPVPLPELPCQAECQDIHALREENRQLWEHVQAAEAASAISRELVIQQFQEVERVLALLQQENALRKGILDAAAAISIIYCDLDGIVRLFNRGAEHLLGYAAADVVDSLPIARIHLEVELTAAGGVRGLANAARRRRLESREWTYVTRSGATVPVMLSVSAVLDQDDNAVGLMLAATDISAAKAAEAALRRKNEELAELLAQLRQAHEQLLQAEKMASLGQLAAGVAHEINNPIGFVNSNLSTLGAYARQLLQVIAAYEGAEGVLAADPVALAAVRAIKAEMELDYIKEDLVALIHESADGLRRVTRIVQDLRSFAHVGETEWAWADIHEGIDSTLNVAANEIKNRAQVVKRFGDLPEVYCQLSQLNQVFMIVLVNAVQAMDQPGTITIRTERLGDQVRIAIADTGKGIAAEHLKRVFDPFFTTKPVGKGTGLGLYLAFNIVKKHQGDIEVVSEPGRGCTFTIRLPIKPEAEGERLPTTGPSAADGIT